METTKPRTVNSIGMFDMLKGAGMLAIVLGHTAELYPLQLEGGLSLTAFVGFIYRETLMAAFFIASGYGFRKRSISKCIHQQLKSLLKPFCYTAVFTTVLHFIIHYKTFHYLPGSMTESIKVAGGFLLGLPHTATYFGQEFFSCGPSDHSAMDTQSVRRVARAAAGISSTAAHRMQDIRRDKG